MARPNFESRRESFGTIPSERYRMDKKPRSSVARRRARPWVEALEDRALLSTITVTNTGDTGPGTLRAAIEQANLDAAQDTIDLAPAVTGTITLSTALPDLSTNMIIAGPGSSALSVARSGADGTPDFRIFTVMAGVEVSISGLTITGGRAGSGGGISNSGTMTLTDCTISGNSAGGGIFNFSGGGIFSSGTMTLTDCTIMGNTTILGDGSGGGIFNLGTMTLTDCCGQRQLGRFRRRQRRRHRQRGHADSHRLYFQRQLGQRRRRDLQLRHADAHRLHPQRQHGHRRRRRQRRRHRQLRAR